MHQAGSEFSGETIDEYKKVDKEEEIQYRLPFGGGAGAGVTINPIAFLVIQSNGVKLIPINHNSPIDKLLDYMPDLIEKVNNVMNKCINDKKEDNKKTVNKMKNVEINKNKKENEDNELKKEPKLKDDEELEFEYDETLEDE